MTSKHQIQFERDIPSKKIIVTRYFDGTVQQVWTAWTESELLELWWAPKPYRAETKSMNFKAGGSWLYAMVGPDQSKNWCKVEFKSIEPQKSFEVTNMFCDEAGVPNTEFPVMSWKNTFHPSGNGTKVTIEIYFDSEKDLNKILELGFEEGFASALGNLDEVLSIKQV